jgi:predicted acyltransferase
MYVLYAFGWIYRMIIACLGLIEKPEKTSAMETFDYLGERAKNFPFSFKLTP